MRLSAILSVLALYAGSALAQAEKVAATLKGHAVLPAQTFVAPPADAPKVLRAAGRFVGPGNVRTQVRRPVAGAAGLTLPFDGQPVQGFSGVKHIGGGIYWALSDNGFGSKANSPDVMLMAHQIRPDWTTGQVQILRTVFLSDPNKVVPFRIATEFTGRRYLTGADFDIEAIQPIGDMLYFGDEFGPFVLATNLDGEVVFVSETFLGSRKLVSPDHPAQRLPALPNRAIAFDVRRSRGHEGMARSPDGSRLYPLIEGPIWDPETGDLEQTQDGRAVLRMLEFLVAQRAWTPNSWTYVLEDPRHAIGDFNMISETHGLVIERDGGQGVPDAACADGQDPKECFARPAVFKRVYLIEIGAPGTAVRKLAYVDLMDIQDPDGVARLGGARWPFHLSDGHD